MLRLAFLEPMGITPYSLAKSIGDPATRIGDILHTRHDISSVTGVLLDTFFGLSNGYWGTTSGRLRRMGGTADIGGASEPYLASVINCCLPSRIMEGSAFELAYASLAARSVFSQPNSGWPKWPFLAVWE
jgi:hypothetical protein